MENFEQKIEEFEQEYQKIKQEPIDDFEKTELRYSALINKGTLLLNYLKSNPELFLKNTNNNLNNYRADIPFIAHLIELKKMRLKNYAYYAKFLITNKKFHQAINIFEQMYKDTGNYIFKKDIANIYLVALNNSQKCFEIYKEIEPYFEKDSRFWWEYSETYKIYGDYFNQLLCIKKAISIEMEKQTL